MKHIAGVVSIVAVATVAAIIASGATTASTTTNVEADAHNQDRGYVGFDITTFRQGRYLIEAVVEGTDGNYRDRKIIMTTGSTGGHAWTLFDIVTEVDSAEVWWGYVDVTTIAVKIDDEPFLEIELDSNGDAEVTYFNDELEVGFSVMHFFIGVTDSNLGSEIDARTSVPVAQVAPGGPVGPPPCWGPCNVGPCAACCFCCASGCPAGNPKRVCKFLCQVTFTTPPTPGPNGTPPIPCSCP